MRVWPRYVAPAGSPIAASDLARWIATLAADPSAVETLCADVAKRSGARYCGAVCTGRAALTVILRALLRTVADGRGEVILPAYTCYSVAASVVRAGFTPRVVDIDPDTLDFNWSALEAVDTKRVAALIATNLYGLPNDMPRLAAFARERRLMLIDDAAQALGASIAGRQSGTWGDVGIFSLDKGKNLSAIDGGLIISNNEPISAAVKAEIDSLPPAPPADVARALIKLAAYAAMLRPSLYWIPNAIPQLRLGQTVYDDRYAVEKYNRPLAALAATMFRRLEEFTAARRSNGEWLRRRLGSTPGITLITPRINSSAVYLRFPFLVNEPALRPRVIEALNAAGIGATASYPRSIGELPELASMGGPFRVHGGAAVAARIVTLPTHPLVRHADLERAADVVETLARAHGQLARGVEAIA